MGIPGWATTATDSSDSKVASERVKSRPEASVLPGMVLDGSLLSGVGFEEIGGLGREEAEWVWMWGLCESPLVKGGKGGEGRGGCVDGK